MLLDQAAQFGGEHLTLWRGQRCVVIGIAGRTARDAETASEREARNRLRVRVVESQRVVLTRMRDTGEIGDDAFHVIEETLDITEVGLRS